MAIEPGRILDQRYRLLRPVGQGSQASVWVAEHLALTTQVAVKLIDPELAKKDSARERFRREATAAAQLRSAHVVQILDHGIDGEQPFIVMELLDGEDLYERLAQRRRLTLRETSKIVTQAARALSRAHAAGIVHRDLKPENVFLVSNDDDEVVKVLDFGVAKVTDPAKVTMRKTGAGTLIGTPHYMSPEQVKGIGEVDHRTDLWAIGVIAFQCVTGDLPFDSEGVGDLLIRITIDEIPVPSKVYPGAPASFDAWFAKACARDPAQRFQSARELAVALAAAVTTFEGSARVATTRPPPIEPVTTTSADTDRTADRLPTADELIALDPDLEPFDEDTSDRDLVPRPPMPSSSRRLAVASPATPRSSPSSAHAPPQPGQALEASGIATPPTPPSVPGAPASGRPPEVDRALSETPPFGPKPPTRSISRNEFLIPATPVAAEPPLEKHGPPGGARRSGGVASREASLRSLREGTTVQSELVTLPPPELDAGARRRRLIRYLIVGVVLGAAGVTWSVVQSRLQGSETGLTPGLAPAASEDPSGGAAPSVEFPGRSLSGVTAASAARVVAPGHVSRQSRPSPPSKTPPRPVARPRRPSADPGVIELPDPAPNE
jgi:serine/threonine-protein kinase